MAEMGRRKHPSCSAAQVPSPVPPALRSEVLQWVARVVGGAEGGWLHGAVRTLVAAGHLPAVPWCVVSEWRERVSGACDDDEGQRDMCVDIPRPDAHASAEACHSGTQRRGSCGLSIAAQV